MASPWLRRDRISDLPDGVLGHVLSFLPTPEAGRAAVLSRRWRYIFGHMDTVSFEEYEGERSSDWETFYFEAKEFKSCSHKLLDGISAALLCRRRCAGDHVPLRSLRFAFHRFKPKWDALHVDQWLNYALDYADRELHLDLRFILGGHTCAHNGPPPDIAYGYRDETDSDSDDEHQTWACLLPRRLFSCAALTTLCLGYCLLKPAGEGEPAMPRDAATDRHPPRLRQERPEAGLELSRPRRPDTGSRAPPQNPLRAPHTTPRFDPHMLPQRQVHPYRRVGAGDPGIPRRRARRVAPDPPRLAATAALMQSRLLQADVQERSGARRVQEVHAELLVLEPPPPAPRTPPQRVPHRRRSPAVPQDDAAGAAGPVESSGSRAPCGASWNRRPTWRC
ncbi:hypothetical protein ACQ4PT_045629 [Festuca glaucescens]